MSRITRRPPSTHHLTPSHPRIRYTFSVYLILNICSQLKQLKETQTGNTNGTAQHLHCSRPFRETTSVLINQSNGGQIHVIIMEISINQSIRGPFLILINQTFPFRIQSPEDSIQLQSLSSLLQRPLTDLITFLTQTGPDSTLDQEIREPSNQI